MEEEDSNEVVNENMVGRRDDFPKEWFSFEPKIVMVLGDDSGDIERQLGKGEYAAITSNVRYLLAIVYLKQTPLPDDLKSYTPIRLVVYEGAERMERPWNVQCLVHIAEEDEKKVAEKRERFFRLLEEGFGAGEAAEDIGATWEGGAYVRPYAEEVEALVGLVRLEEAVSGWRKLLNWPQPVEGRWRAYSLGAFWVLREEGTGRWLSYDKKSTSEEPCLFAVEKKDWKGRTFILRGGQREVKALRKEGQPVLYEVLFSRNLLRSLPPNGDFGAVRGLDLSNCGLREVPGALGKCVRLRTLDLQGNELKKLPDFFEKLTNLQVLLLNLNPLQQLGSYVKGWKSMITLGLSFCKLTELPKGVGRWTSLHALSLDENNLTELPKEVGRWTSLHTLDLGYNKLTKLPEEVGRWESLKSLYIGENPLDPKFLDMSLEELVSYHRELLEGASYCPRQRVMVVGKNEKGKTSLLIRLKSGKAAPKLEKEDRTFGIDIQPWKDSSIRVEDGKGEEVEVEIEFWDFAGQPVFYPTHQMFLELGAVYWIVFSWADEEDEAIVEEIEDFFQFVSACCAMGDETQRPPIQIIGTHVDVFKGKVGQFRGLYKDVIEGLSESKTGLADANVLKRDDKKIHAAVVSSQMEEVAEDGVDLLLEDLEEVVGKLKHLTDPVPTLYLEVENKVLEKRKSIEWKSVKHGRVSAKEFGRHVRGYAEFPKTNHSTPPKVTQKWFEENLCPNAEDPLSLLKWLHRRGTVLFREQEGTVFLDPQWITREVICPMVTVANEGTRISKQQREGILTKGEIQNHWLQFLNAEVCECVPDILENFELAFPTDKDTWMAPLLLDVWKEKEDGVFVDEELHWFRFRLSYVPYGFFSLLLFRLFKLQPDADKCRLRKDRMWLRVGEKVVWIEIEEQNRIKVGVRNKEAAWLAEIVLRKMEWLVEDKFPGLSLRVEAGERGKTVGLEEVRGMLKKGKTKCFVGKDEYECMDLVPHPPSSKSIKLPSDKTFHVFLAHAGEDKEVVWEVYRTLREAGLEVALDWESGRKDSELLRKIDLHRLLSRCCGTVELTSRSYKNNCSTQQEALSSFRDLKRASGFPSKDQNEMEFAERIVEEVGRWFGGRKREESAQERGVWKSSEVLNNSNAQQDGVYKMLVVWANPSDTQRTYPGYIYNKMKDAAFKQIGESRKNLRLEIAVLPEARYDDFLFKLRNSEPDILMLIMHNIPREEEANCNLLRFNGEDVDPEQFARTIVGMLEDSRLQCVVMDVCNSLAFGTQLEHEIKVKNRVRKRNNQKLLALPALVVTTELLYQPQAEFWTAGFVASLVQGNTYEKAFGDGIFHLNANVKKNMVITKDNEVFRLMGTDKSNSLSTGDDNSNN